MVRATIAGLLLALSSLVAAQHEGWAENQVNASICLWEQPRAAVIRDTVYLDGGFIYWSQGLSNGEMGPIEQKDNPLGLIYMLNFSRAFETSDNVTALLDVQPKSLGGTGRANNFAPNYLDGAMLVNDAQLSLYGGLMRNTTAYKPPDEDDVLTYQIFNYGTEMESFESSFVLQSLPENMTRYVAYGGAVSAPSENKAWYFGGLRAPDWGEIFQIPIGNDATALNVSDTLITVDMETQVDPKWSNVTLPSDIKGRANPEVVWVPVGEEGILVVLGGVTYPYWVSPSGKSENPAQSKRESDEFMETIDIYDIANDEWYQQPTEDGPSARARGCAVVAPAQDSSSFNIYYYGGSSGVDTTEDMSDEVWVLSLPSFTWTKLSEGRRDYGRSGHKCFMPYPDQMMVIGGMTPLAGSNPACLMGGLIQVYNLTSGEWMDGYDPEKHYDYGVPSAVVDTIGGDSTGGASVTTPDSGWADDDLADVFETSYSTSKITTWYPYNPAEDSDRPVVETTPNDGDGDDDSGGDGGGGGGVPSWVAPTLGVVLGLVFITALLVAFCLWKKRKSLRPRGDSEASTDENGNRVLSWIRGQPSGPSEAKAPTVTTSEETRSRSDMMEARSPQFHAVPVVAQTPAQPHEAMDTGLVELPDTSKPPELSDTGLTHIDVINRHSVVGTGSPVNRSTGQTSYLGSVSGNEASSVSRSSGIVGANSRGESPARGPSPLGEEMATGEDVATASVGAGAAGAAAAAASSTPRSRVKSGVSIISERESGHLRQISEATVSSASDGENESSSSGRRRAEPPRSIPMTMAAEPTGPQTGAAATPPLGGPQSSPSPMSPDDISPPTAGYMEDSDDYISARRIVVSPTGNASPLRRSVFRESEDDMGVDAGTKGDGK